jgi:hypothetical protein
MLPLIRTALGGGLAILATQAFAAELGQKYTSYLDMHKETAYGSLFFNEGSIRERDSKTRKRFAAIKGSGDLDLPSQQGYCFVFNHYGRGETTTATFQYRAKITKEFKDGRKTEQTISRPYSPTDDAVSPNLPDLCVSGLNNVSKVTIDFSSDDGENFSWTISFAIK